MQTFLPYISFKASVECLDNKRLGKQRVESKQIIDNLIQGGHWQNHPAVLMWEGYYWALVYYYNTCIEAWVKRGYNNNMEKIPIQGTIKNPWFIGYNNFHNSHKSNLLRKDPLFYGQYGWKVESNLFYSWPDNDKKEFRIITPKWYKDQQKEKVKNG